MENVPVEIIGRVLTPYSNTWRTVKDGMDLSNLFDEIGADRCSAKYGGFQILLADIFQISISLAFQKL